MLYNCELIHPVHEGMALFDDTFEFATNTGDEFITGKEIAGVHRLLSCPQKISFDSILFKVLPSNKPALFKFLDNPRTFPAVNTELLPEVTLEDTFGS